MRPNFQRIHIHLPPTRISQLRTDAKQKGISVAELIRRILELHYEG